MHMNPGGRGPHKKQSTHILRLPWGKLPPIVFFAYIVLAVFFFHNLGRKAEKDKNQESAEVLRLRRELQEIQRQVVQNRSQKLSTEEKEQELPPGAQLRSLQISYPITSDEALDARETKVKQDGAYDPQQPLFSIVIAAFNQGRFLEETVQSLVNQSYTRWELIIIDDGSTDDTFSHASSLIKRHKDRQIRLIRKRNGGLADARNFGLRVVRGSWLCMLDSDDLLGPSYLQRAAELSAADRDVMIVAGCMRNFDAVSSDWCFPEGFSAMGIAHWNKFHASVLVNRELMARVGGYDPSIPWGLEDWNFWLSASRFHPKVAFVPELTFWYRHHAGSSMRKKMFSLYLEETKAMVRTNHHWLYEPHQLLLDHSTVANMADETAARLEEKLFLFPDSSGPLFWRALRRVARGEREEAMDDFLAAETLDDRPGARRLGWQIHYRLALLYEERGRMEDALEQAERAMEWGYFDELLATKWRIERDMESRPRKRPMARGGIPVTVQPSYWQRELDQEAIREGTLAGRLARLSRLERTLPTALGERSVMISLLQLAAANSCPPGIVHSGPLNLLANPHFVGGSKGWSAYGDGFVYDTHMGRFQVREPAGSIMLESRNESHTRAASQVLKLLQPAPAALVVSGWSKSRDVSGEKDAGYSLYLDITFNDGSHEWGYNLPFETGSHGWARVHGYVNRPKGIRQIEVYCMFRRHTGLAWFDDISIAPLAKVFCESKQGFYYNPSPQRDMEPCPENSICTMGLRFDNVGFVS